MSAAEASVRRLGRCAAGARRSRGGGMSGVPPRAKKARVETGVGSAAAAGSGAGDAEVPLRRKPRPVLHVLGTDAGGAGGAGDLGGGVPVDGVVGVEDVSSDDLDGPVEVLVHNVSHRDFIVSVQHNKDEAVQLAPVLSGAGGTSKGPNNKEVLSFGRPKFSHFQPVGVKLLESLCGVDGAAPDLTSIGHQSEEGVNVNVGFSFRECCAPQLACAAAMLLERGCDACIGGCGSRRLTRWILISLDTDDELVEMADWDMFHWRDHRVQDPTSKPMVNGCYFPLLAVIMPMWLRSGTESGRAESEPSRRYLYLVSGSGTPRDATHDKAGNSTESTAALMKLFVETHWPDVEVVLISSGAGVFRFEDNVKFVNKELLPQIEERRGELVASFGDEWGKNLRLTVSMCHGTPARLAAINAGLRPYRPNYLHMWELKSFWYDAKITESDVDLVSFDRIEAKPVVSRLDPELSSEVRALVAHMIEYKNEFEKIRHSKEHSNELASFWLRKTKKPVLSVLMVQRDGEEAAFYKGMNMEVSMPTGSLCSERNVIGTALASDQTLTRRHLKMIAVLSVQLVTKKGIERHRSRSSTLTSETKPSDVRKARSPIKQVSSDALIGSSSLRRHGSLDGTGSAAATKTLEPPGTPMSLTSERRHKWPGQDPERDTYVGLNPISPCGACMEWLRKVAEVNPDFRVVTFTDPSCDSIVVKEVADL